MSAGDVLVLTLDPAHLGGIATMRRAATRALSELGLRPHLAYLRSGRRSRWDPRARHGVHEEGPSLSCGYLPTVEYLNYVVAARALRREIRRFAAVHVVSSFHSPSLVPILCRRPFVSWVASPYRDEIEGRRHGGRSSTSVRINHAARGLNERIERWTYRHARRVWALSSYTARRLEELHGLSPERLAVQGAPVDTAVFRPDGPRWSGRRYILSVGRLDEERKDYPLLLRAFAADVAPSRDVDLVLAGPGGESSGLAPLAGALGVAARVRFPGVLAEADLAAAYRGAALFVLPSRQEGLGLVVLEAQSCGLACLATRCGGIEDLVASGATGLLVEPGDERNLGRGMLRLLDDQDEARRLGEAARGRVEREWSVSAFTERMRSLYAEAFPGIVR